MREPRPRCRLAGGIGIVVVALALGCGRAALTPGAVARIGEREVGWPAFAAYVEEVAGEPADTLESDVLRGLFEQFVEEELLLELALDRELVGPQASRRQAAAAMLGPSAVAVGDEELRRHYEEHAAELVAPERVVLRHLLFEERSTAEQARSRILAGEPPERIAEELSALGLEEVEAARADLPRDYADTLMALEPGGVAVVGDGFQHHVFVAAARLPAGPLGFEEAAPVLRRRLEAERVRTRRAELLLEARGRYNVRIAEERLPFALAPGTASQAVPEAPEIEP
jgi:hypothetical protein